MNRILALLALLLPAVPVHGWHGDWSTGYSILSYDSDFTAKGIEQAVPVTLRLSALDGRLRFHAGGAYLKGDYRREAWASSGVAAARYDAGEIADTVLGAAFEAPLGAFESAIAIQADLPTGDERWEQSQLTDRQTPGNLPLTFFPSRYRGRGFGFNALAGLGRRFSDWDFGIAGGYLRSGSMDLGTVDAPAEYDPGDVVVGILTAARKIPAGKIRGKAAVSFPQASRVDGSEAFVSPSSTTFEIRFQTPGRQRFSVNFSTTLFAKGRVTDAAGVLVDEERRSLGPRIEVRPSYRYAAGADWILETRARWKQVGPNGYPASDLRFEGGGNLLGLGQNFRIGMGGGFFLTLDGAYDHLLHEKAARDADYRLTAVTYNVLALKTGVGVAW